jgi:cell shape-determining protein MreC
LILQSQVENRLNKEVKKVKALLQLSEEKNAELLAENARLKEFFMQQQQGLFD